MKSLISVLLSCVLAICLCVSSLAAQTVQQPLFHKQLDNALQVFFGDALPFGNLLERDISVGVLFGQVDKHPQRVAAPCGNHHHKVPLTE